MEWFKEWFENFSQTAAMYFPFLQDMILDHPLWEYFAYFIWLLVGWKLTNYLSSKAQTRMSVWILKHRGSFSGHLIEKLITPLRAAILFSLVFCGLQIFQLSSQTATWHAQAYTLAIGVCTTIVFVRFGEVILWNWKHNYHRQHHSQLNMQLYTLVEKGGQLFIVLTMSLMTLHNMGVNITSLLASLSIGSLAIALAAQDTLSNLFGAVSILADNTFKVGDRIKIDQHEGYVTAIGLRSTRIRNLEGCQVTVPNKNMGVAVIINVSQREFWKSTIRLALDHSNSKEKIILACELLDKIFRSDSHLRELSLGLKSFDTGVLQIEVNYAIDAENYSQYLALLHKINLSIKENFDREEISFSLPSSTIYVTKN